MLASKYNAPIKIILGVILLYLFSHYFYAINLIAHSIVDIFAGGRSTVKLNLYLFYTLFLCVLFLIVQKFNFKIPKIQNFYILGLIISTFAYNLLLIYIFFKKFDFKLNSFVITFHNGEISSTTLLHNHLMKGFNALILGPFGLANNENVDTGFAFIGLIHNIWFLIGGAMVVLCSILLIIKFLELNKIYYGQQHKWQSLYIIIFSIITFSLIKKYARWRKC